MGLIQVAGVKDLKEAELLMELGVDDIAFPLGPEVKDEDLSEWDAKRVIEHILPPHSSVLITYLTHHESILSVAKKLRVQKIQLHGTVSKSSLINLREKWEGKLIKSVIIGEKPMHSQIKDIRSWEPYVDFFLTDTYDPITGRWGATGKTHDWKESRELVKLTKRGVILAGGLNAKNVGSAILSVRPFGVDVHTGVEAKDGRKDKNTLKEFVKVSRNAFKSIDEGYPSG